MVESKGFWNAEQIFKQALLYLVHIEMVFFTLLSLVSQIELNNNNNHPADFFRAEYIAFCNIIAEYSEYNVLNIIEE